MSLGTCGLRALALATLLLMAACAERTKETFENGTGAAKIARTTVSGGGAAGFVVSELRLEEENLLEPVLLARYRHGASNITWSDPNTASMCIKGDVDYFVFGVITIEGRAYTLKRSC